MKAVARIAKTSQRNESWQNEYRTCCAWWRVKTHGLITVCPKCAFQHGKVLLVEREQSERLQARLAPFTRETYTRALQSVSSAV